MRPRQRGKNASLVQIAAAIVGSAAATQVVTPVPEIVQRDHRRGACWCGTRHSLTDLPLPAAAHAEGLDVHAALNTYEARPGELEGATEELDTLGIVGANGRRLIARWAPDGVWIGGCLITDEAVADRLAAFITREDESQ